MPIAIRSWEAVKPLSPADASTRERLRPMLALRKGELAGPGARQAYAAMMEHMQPAPGIAYEPDVLGGVNGWWCKPPNASSSRVLLHLHGGWFVFGSAQTYRNFVGNFALRSGIATFIADYRLAPEHPLHVSGRAQRNGPARLAA
jgi:epsilon-lactone hydrolase